MLAAFKHGPTLEQVEGLKEKFQVASPGGMRHASVDGRKDLGGGDMWHNRALSSVVFGLSLILVSGLWALPTSPGDAEDAVKGWLRMDIDPLGMRLGEAIDRVESFPADTGAPLYFVVYLKPQGFVIVSADDRIEPIIAFSSAASYDSSADNLLGVLVRRDLEGRTAAAGSRGTVSMYSRGGRLAAAALPRTKAQRKWDRLIGMGAGEGATIRFEAIERTEEIEDLRVWPLLQLDPGDPNTWMDWGQGAYGLYHWDPVTHELTLLGARACFNYYTPPSDPSDPNAVGDPNNYPAGCPATAMAQLMRYHRWPQDELVTLDPATRVRKSFTIKVTTDDKTTSKVVHLLGGSGENGAYNWTKMDPQPFRKLLKMEDWKEIGALCYDAGISVGTSYAEGGAGIKSGELIRVKNAFVDVFGYADATLGYRKGLEVGTGLVTMINPNLDSGHPVILFITGEDTATQEDLGHAAACDGYGYHDATLYHHLNMGWPDGALIALDDSDEPVTYATGDTDDVWYNLPDINDVDCLDVILDDSEVPGFDTVVGCVYNVFRETSGEIISGRVLDGLGRPVESADVHLEIGTTLIDSCATNDKGIFSFVGCDSDTLYTVSVPGMGYPDQAVLTGTSKDFGVMSGNRWGINFPASVNQASNPTPPDGAIGVTSTTLTWQAGATAIWHDLYFGMNADPPLVERLSEEVYEHQAGFEPGAKYYWRVDEVEPDGKIVSEGQLWSFTAARPAPQKVTDPSPADGSHVTSTTVLLSWSTAQDAATYDVYFGSGRSAVAGGAASVHRGRYSATTFNPGPLARGTTYHWRVDAIGIDGVKTEGDVWDFTTVPGKASHPNPNNSAEVGPTGTVLSWTAGPGAAAHAVYFSDSPATLGSSSTYRGKLTTTTYEPGALDIDTTYYWRIDELGPAETRTVGDTWNFRVVGQLKAQEPSPVDRDPLIADLTPLLRWSPGATATEHRVYMSDFHSGSTTLKLMATLPASVTSYWPDEKEWIDGRWVNFTDIDFRERATCRWRIDEVDAAGQVHQGDVWTFYAIHGQCYDPTPADGGTLQLREGAKLEWMAPAGEYPYYDIRIMEEPDYDDPFYSLWSRSFIYEPWCYVPADIGLVPGRTYYWTVEPYARDDNGAWIRGHVWSFTAE